MMNDTGFMQHLEQPQVFNFEIIIDRVRIIKGDQRNFIPPDESHKATKPPSFHGSIKKKKRRKKSRKRSSKKGRKKRKSRKGSRKGSKKSSKSGSKKGSRGGSKKGSKSSSKKGSKSSSKKGSKSSSKKGSPKGKKSPKGSSKGKKKRSKKDKKKKSKGSKKGKKGSKSSKKKHQSKQETLPGNRKEIPPLRLGINVLGFHDIYINQIDVDPLEEEEFISAGDTPYTSSGGAATGTTDSSEHGPVDPQKLAKALEDAQKGKDKKKNRKSKSSSRRSKKKSKSGSSSKKGSGTKRGSKKISKGGSKKASKGGSKKVSKGGSRKASKRGSKKGSKGGSKKRSPKGKKRKSKSPKGKKKSGKRTPKKKPADTPSTVATEPVDTWSLASETAIKRGRAIMLTEVPRRMITQFQGSPIKIRVERYGGKHHNNGEVIPVGTVTVPFPPDWSEAVLEEQREINPRTYDASAFPIERGLVGRYSIKDSNNEHIGDIKLEINLYCFANTAVSKLFPTDASLYDALLESENIPKCCDAMTNKRKGRRSNAKSGAYYGYKPGDPNPYEYAWEYAMKQKELEKENPALYKSMNETYGRMMGDYRVTMGGNPEYGRRPLSFTGGAEENYAGQPGECYDVYPKAKNMNYTEQFNL